MTGVFNLPLTRLAIATYWKPRGHSGVRWTELLQLIFGWVLHRRPREERADWVALSSSVNDDDIRSQEVQHMAQATIKTLADEFYENGVRELMMTQARQKFGEPPVMIEDAVRSIENLATLRRMGIRFLTATSWAELLDTP